MAKEHKLDIFDLLAAVDRRDIAFLDRQEPEVRKGFAPYVAIRWASSVRGREADAYLYAVNEVVNVDFQALREHPELQYKLLALCGSGKPERHDWIAPAKGTKSAASKIHAFLNQFYPLASAGEIDLLISQHTEETFGEFVNGSGATPEEIKDLISAFKKERKR